MVAVIAAIAMIIVTAVILCARLPSSGPPWALYAPPLRWERRDRYDTLRSLRSPCRVRSTGCDPAVRFVTSWTDATHRGQR